MRRAPKPGDVKSPLLPQAANTNDLRTDCVMLRSIDVAAKGGLCLEDTLGIILVVST